MTLLRISLFTLLLLASGSRLHAQFAGGGLLGGGLLGGISGGACAGGGCGMGAGIMGPAGLGGGMPGYHPAAVMMGQEFFDPTMGGAAPSAGCCGPNWYDFMVEGVYMDREDAGRDLGFSSNGIRGLGPPNLVLANDDIDFDFDTGLRASARYQMGALHSIEVGFLGALDWKGFASATSNNDDLYSAFSDFGNTPFGGFDDVDQAAVHSVLYRSDLDTVEVNMRRSWGDGMRFHGSWLAGVRYLRLYEKFRFRANVDPHFDPINAVNRGAAFTNYSIITDNDLVGSQIGGQFGLCLSPGINWNTEFKVGLYSNQSDQNSSLTSTTVNPALAEQADSDDVAFVGDFGTSLIYQIHPMLKMRGGYYLMYVDGVALASENFNSQPPFGGLPRSVSINDNGSLLIHGGTFGLEFGW